MGRRLLLVFACLSAAVWAGCAAGQTGSPVSVSGTGATLGGHVVSTVGGQVEFWAQYGPTKAYGSETAHDTVVVQAGVPYPVAGELTIDGLARSTTYHYRLCARDSQQPGGAPGCGVDVAFTTQSFDCGETVTQSVRLTGDVSCGFATPGLVVGASGIDINLAGHRLGGAFGSGGAGPAGIVNSGGHSDVTIRNGRLVGSNAVRLVGASRNSIRDVDATSGQTAIHIEGGEANEVRASTVLARGTGVDVIGSDRAVIADTRLETAMNIGINLDADSGRIARNDVVRQDNALIFLPGIEVTGSGNRVVDNRVSGPWAGGGIVVLSGAGNVIAENEPSTSSPPAIEPEFGDGIFVGPLTTGTLLRDNTATGNSHDGIEVQSADARLRDNSASNNGDLGIDAAAGVTDLGGNRAFGNGNPLQCRNVFCL